MNFRRIGALIERDMRKFFRSPALMMISMVFPLVQLDRAGVCIRRKSDGRRKSRSWIRTTRSESRKMREMFDGITAGPRTFQVIEYDSVPQATRRSAKQDSCGRWW